MPISVLDLAVIGVVLMSALLAAVRGFTREVLAIVAWVAAAAAAWFLHPLLLPYVKQHLQNPTVALVAAIGGIFIVTLIIVSIITVKVSDMILDSRIGAIDRTLGFAFGAGRGLLICVIGWVFLAWLVQGKMPEWATTARSRPMLENTGNALTAMLPDNPDGLLKQLRKPRNEGDAVEPPTEPDPQRGAPPLPPRRSDAGQPSIAQASVSPCDRNVMGPMPWPKAVVSPDRTLAREPGTPKDTLMSARSESWDINPHQRDLDLDGDTLREECGVFGIFGHPDAAAITTLGLHALQHRGQEAAGIVSFDGQVFHLERKLGLVGDGFSDRATIERLRGLSAIGHVRYSTTGETILRNVQPLFAELEGGGFAVAHNGNLTNGLTLRRELIHDGAICQSTTDTEVIVHLVARGRKPRVVERFIDAVRQLEGAYSLVALTNKKLIGARDPLGIRPLVLGELDGRFILASETCALDIIGARFVRDIENGEVVVISEEGIESLRPFPPQRMRPDIFEYIYFARPDSMVNGRSVYDARKGMGAQLAREAPADTDVVIPVPDSGVPAAIGFSQACGTPYELGIIRNHYVGRTFIEPTQAVRELGVRLKHSANRAVVAGKRIVLIDDSLVRGTTSVKIVRMMREAGAREVHFRIASPPITHPDFYGIDTPEKDKLLAATHDLEGMRAYIGADSLAFLSIDGLYRAMGFSHRDPVRPQFTDHCFTGDYPTPLTDLAVATPRRLAMLAEAD